MKTIEVIAFAPVRRCVGGTPEEVDHEFILPHEICYSIEDVEREALRTEVACGASRWGKDNPVVRIVKVEIRESDIKVEITEVGNA